MENNITHDNPGNFQYDDLFLPVAKNVVLNRSLADSIIAVRPYYAARKHKATITSGYRSPDYQLQLIMGFIRDNGFVEQFFELSDGIMYSYPVNKFIFVDGDSYYWWQRGWSHLLGLGFIINPPIAAMCLEHSLRSDGTDRFHSVIPVTPHANGTAYDQDGGTDHDPTDEFAIMQVAAKDLKCKIRGLVIERKQSCVHTDIGI
jgi:hypothetical protein